MTSLIQQPRLQGSSPNLQGSSPVLQGGQTVLGADLGTFNLPRLQTLAAPQNDEPCRFTDSQNRQSVFERSRIGDPPAVDPQDDVPALDTCLGGRRPAFHVGDHGPPRSAEPDRFCDIVGYPLE